jgi:sigma-B regulation protein RsbU (phosphoserine phosphatase)
MMFDRVFVLRRLHLIAGGVLLSLGLSWLLVTSWQSLRLVLLSGTPAWISVPGDDTSRVGVIRPGSPADGVLATGDELVAIDGVGVRRDFNTREYFAFQPPRPYEVLVRRDGELRAFTLPTVEYGLSPASFIILGFVGVGWIFFLPAAAVFVLKPHDRLAFLLFAAFTLFAIGQPVEYPVDALGPLTRGLFLAAQLAGSLFWPTFLHLFLVFPETSPPLKRWPWLVRGTYMLGAAFVTTTVLEMGLRLVDPKAAAALFSDEPALWWVWLSLSVSYALAGLTALVLSHRAATGKARRQLGAVVAGCLLGFLPLVCVMLVQTFWDMRNLGLWAGRFLVFWAILSLPLVPLSFAYAIVRHQVIPVGVLLRRSLRYLLVAKGVLILEALEVGAVVAFLLLGPPADWLAGLPLSAAILFTMSVTAASLALLVLAHRWVMPKIDRRFFRGSYDTQRILAEVGQAARSATSVEEVLHIGLLQAKQALHPESAAAFLKDEQSGHYLLATSEEAGTAALRADSTVVQRLRRSPAPLDAEGDGILLPIVAKGDLLGILSFGPRKGDLPYSGEDRDLLGALAWQIAFAVENARLVRNMVEEQRLRHEIEMARDVQRRLFPARPPELRRLELAGVCHPAQGIGGDYYDFLPMPDGRVGIAVADVAGKGISAALLMSIVQASLRSQYRAGVDLTDLVASMNELLYRSTATNSFATFFLAQFDDTTGRLTYVNAGHNPPLLVRSGPRAGDRLLHARRSAVAAGAVAVALESEAVVDEVRLLHTGGLVIGALAEVSYEAESVELLPGDLLVAYTDGVTEAFDAQELEFGEDRLREVVLAARDLPVEAVVERIVEAVRDFVKDAPQHDDITLVVARVR